MESCDTPTHENKIVKTISYDYSWEEKFIAEQNKIPVGGRLRFFWKHWREIGASKKYARWLNRGYRLPFKTNGEQEARALLSTSCPKFLIPSYPEDSEKGVALREMMTTLLEKDVIETISEGELGFFNVVFLRPKPNKKWRLILDVSRLNVFLNTESFSMDTAEVIRQAVEPKMWGTSIDLSDAYHHIPVHENYRCFLAFQVGDTKYRYKACPFGLSPLPKVFTDISEIVKVYARKQWGCAVFQYIDDWLFLSHSEEILADTTRQFVRLCIKLGLIVNLKKSVLRASRQLVHLGTLWDFETAQVRPTDEKIDNITKMAHVAAQATRMPLPTMESLMGKMVSVERLIPMGRLNYRDFQSILLTELKKGRSFRWVKLTKEAKENMSWWRSPTHLNKWVPVRQPQPSIIIHTDASTHGWGASCDDWTLKGSWDLKDSQCHINILEMRAVELTLQMRATQLKGAVVCFRIDNLSVVYYLNKQGGTRSAFLLQVTKRVLRLAQQYNITIQAVHIKGELNVLADMLSRHEIVLKNEWRLSEETFRWVSQTSPWGPPTLELFANRLNRHLSRYMSPCEDGQAVATDALLSRWPQEVCYAFPPTTILSRVVTKILQEKPKRLLLIAPWWPAKSWFPTLQLNAAVVRLIPESLLRLQQPHFHHFMPSPQLLSLALWCISCQD